MWPRSHIFCSSVDMKAKFEERVLKNRKWGKAWERGSHTHTHNHRRGKKHANRLLLLASVITLS